MHLRDKLLKFRKHDDLKKQRNKVTSMLRAATKTYLQDLVALKNDSRSIRKAINNLTNKAISKPPVTTNDISPDKLNNHFTNVADKVLLLPLLLLLAPLTPGGVVGAPY